MRRLLNILAVLVGLLSLVLILTNVALFAGAAIYYVKSEAMFTADMSMFAVMGLGAGLGFIGCLIGSQALGHLRKPDARSACDVMTTAIYLLVFTGVFPLIKSVPYVLFPLLIGLYFVRRYVIKQIARVFPPEGTASHA